MAILFDFYETPDPSGEGEKKYHARVVTLATTSTDDLCQEIQSQTSLSPGDIKAVLIALNESLVFHLSRSNRVHLEGIGYFQPSLRPLKKIVPGKTHSQSVWFKSIKFRADKQLRDSLKYAVTRRSPVKNHSARLTDETVDKKVKTYLQDHDFIARKDVEELCQFTRSMALRHINRMIGEGKLKNRNTKKYPLYVWGEER